MLTAYFVYLILFTYLILVISIVFRVAYYFGRLNRFLMVNVLLTTGPTVIPVWYVVTLYKHCIIIIIIILRPPLASHVPQVSQSCQSLARRMRKAPHDENSAILG